MKSWYLIYTKQNKELYAKSQLENQKIEVYLPLFMGTKKHARKITYTKKAFFPRYLFVNLDTETTRMQVVNFTYGVSRIVVFEEKPVKVSVNIINSLKEREDENGFIRFSSAELIKIGNKVIINDGPLAGITGIYKGMSDKNRIKVLLDFMGRALTVPLNNNWVSSL